MKYNYLENLKKDILEYLEENGEDLRGKTFDELYDELFLEDSVTGNSSGSYTFNTWQAEENLVHNLDLLKEAANEFDDNAIRYLESPEIADVTIRCYLLGQALEELKDDIKKIINNN